MSNIAVPELSAGSGWLIIWNDIKDFGPSFWVALIFFNLIFLKEQWIKLFDAITNFIWKKSLRKSVEYTKKDLLNHQIFKNIDYWLTYGVNAIRFRSLGGSNNKHHYEEDEDYIQGKENIAKAVIEIKFSTIRDFFKAFVEETNIEELSSEVVSRYIINTITKSRIAQSNKLYERGVPTKFLDKYELISSVNDELLDNSVKLFFDDVFDASTITKTYFFLNSLDAYLNTIFTNISNTVNSINGDLIDCEFDGKPLSKKASKIMRPPHPTYTMTVNEKLCELLKEIQGVRAFIVKYHNYKNNDLVTGEYSCLYETHIRGVTDELENLQNISCTAEGDIIKILKRGEVIAAELCKFGSTTIERFNARGIKAIIICPIFNDGKLDGALCIDFISPYKFKEIISSDTNEFENRIKYYADLLSTYIVYNN